MGRRSRKQSVEALMDHIESLGLPRPKTLGELTELAERARELELDAGLVEAALRQMNMNGGRVVPPKRRVGSARVLRPKGS